MMDSVFSGVMLRQHFMRLSQKQSSKLLSKWVKAGLMNRVNFAHSTLYVLRKNKAFPNSRNVNLTSLLVLRSALRMEYFLSLGLVSPDEILSFVQKGNNCSAQKENPAEDLLSRYKDALAARNIQIPDLANPLNMAALKRLTYHEIYISRLSVKEGKLVPQMIMYLLRDNDISKIARSIRLAIEELQYIFFDESHDGATSVFNLQIWRDGQQPENKILR